jgi:hypothetical protein
MPVISAFRTLRWAKDGTVRIAGQPAPFDIHKANLRFDKDHLALTVELAGSTALAALDIGAETTDLLRQLVVPFPFIVEPGKRSTTQFRGLCGPESSGPTSRILVWTCFNKAGHSLSTSQP